MKRRDFLASASSMLIPLTLNGFGVKSFDQNSALVKSLAASAAVNTDRVLVIIYLGGGNDGLNTIIPRNQYDLYDTLRHNIAIPESAILGLNNNEESGLHPGMTGMKNLYNEGKLGIVHSVSYPNPNQSHIRSTDIWMTAVDSNQYASSGWAGRYLEDLFENYPVGYPNPTMDSPLAIQIGYINSTSLLGTRQTTSISLDNPDTFYNLVNGPANLPTNDLPCCDAGEMIAYIRQQQVLSIGYATEIKQAGIVGRNLYTYPTANKLADQLKVVARLIDGGLNTKIYYVEMGGFDTHAAQVGSTSTEGLHAQLLKTLSDAVFAFQKDLQQLGREDRVLGMTFSDFGRRATSNASKGTDHGVGAPMFVFGSGLKRQVVGTPDLSKDLVPANPPIWDLNQDIKMQIDFRRVYADILNDWFGTSPAKTDTLLFKNFKTTSLFSDTVQTLSSGMWADPVIWSNGRIPASTEKIKINTGHIIEVGHNITAKNIEVAGGGELKFLGNYNVNITG